MLPSHWPKWSLIPIAFGLTLFTVGIGLILEPAAQAIAPAEEPTPTFPILPYAEPLSGRCVDCHTDEAALQGAGAEGDELERALIQPDDVMSLHGRLGCVTCHGGDGQAAGKEEAHQDLVANPSHFEQADKYCLPCHFDMRTEIPEHNIQTPHERILWGIHEDQQVCSCSNCHGAVAHGVHPVRTHDGLGAYCIDCHEEQGVPPERLTCTGCHIGPHDVSGSLDCEVCHTSTETWSRAELAVHPMELTGAHAELECFECHIWPNFRTLSGFECADCHTKPHDFGDENCIQCHEPGAPWGDVKEGGFDHTAVWDYHTGVHTTVDCQGCHFQGYEGLSADCGSCHELNPETCDPEQACVDCHASDVAWSDLK